MNIQSAEVWELLRPRASNTLTNGYCNGLFNPQKDKFFAATFVTEFPAADDLDALMSQFDSGYAITGIPPENSGQGEWRALPPGTGFDSFSIIG